MVIYRRSLDSRLVDNVGVAKIAQETIFFSSDDAGALGFIDVNNDNQVMESGDVASLAEGQFLESVNVCFLPLLA